MKQDVIDRFIAAFGRRDDQAETTLDMLLSDEVRQRLRSQVDFNHGFTGHERRDRRIHRLAPGSAFLRGHLRQQRKPA